MPRHKSGYRRSQCLIQVSWARKGLTQEHFEIQSCFAQQGCLQTTDPRLPPLQYTFLPNLPRSPTQIPNSLVPCFSFKPVSVDKQIKYAHLCKKSRNILVALTNLFCLYDSQCSKFCNSVYTSSFHHSGTCARSQNIL